MKSLKMLSFGAMDRLIIDLPLEEWKILLSYPTEGEEWKLFLPSDYINHKHHLSLQRKGLIVIPAIADRTGFGFRSEKAELYVGHVCLQ